MPTPTNIVKTFPKKGDMQQFRLEQLAQFTCARCEKGCCGELLSKE